MNTNALRHWVTESTRSACPGGGISIECRIQAILDIAPPLEEELILYRGHSQDRPYILPTSWFATSSDLNKVKRQHISKGADCCLFKLHIMPGIRILHVDDVFTKAGKAGTGYDESEILVNGGGIFYTTVNGTNKGFKEAELLNGVQVYEAWYRPPPTILSAKRVFERIPSDEYDFIESLEDLKGIPGLLSKGEIVENSTWEPVWAMIEKAKKGESATEGGGRRRRQGANRTTRKRRTRKSKCHVAAA